jgi:hypothetical protein
VRTSTGAIDVCSGPVAIAELRLNMRNSSTVERSRIFTNVRFDWRAIAAIAALIGVWGWGGGAGQPADNHPPSTARTITAISPNSAIAGGAGFALTIDGSNLVAGSMINFGGAVPATTFISSTQLTATIPASSITATGTLAVTVTNPAPGGGTFMPMNFTPLEVDSNENGTTVRVDLPLGAKACSAS